VEVFVTIRVSHVLPLIFLLLSRVAGAQPQASEEDELALVYGDNATVSIATGNQQSLRRAPAVASIITAEEIAAMGATDLDQVLETVPGIHVTVSADGYSPIYAIRGVVSPLNNPQVLMLQNGIPMTISYAGDRGRYGSTLPVGNIARVEIIRGPGSALYGADALAGVINVITKTAADAPGTEVGVRLGSFKSRDSWIQHGGKLGAVDVAAYLRVGSTDGFKSTIGADNATRLDHLFKTQASLAPGAVNVGHDDIDASLDLAQGQWRLRGGYKLREHMGTGAGISSALDPHGQNRSERITTDLSWNDNQLTRDWSVGATASYLEYHEQGNYQLFPPGTQFPTGVFADGMLGNPARDERQLRLSAFSTFTGFDKQQLRFGLGHDDLNLYRTETFKNYFLNASGLPVPSGPIVDYNAMQPHIPPHRRKLNYLFVQDEWSMAPDWTLTAGVRRDAYSDFGGTTNPRLALVWDTSLDLTTKLLYGRAFRAPSFNDQYGTNPVGSGNPGIRPESARTLELAFAWQARRDTQVNLGFFHYQMKDVILARANQAPALGSTYANIGAQHGRGMELEAVWRAKNNLRLSGHYAYQQSIDETTNSDVGYAPHHHLYGRADWGFYSGWLASAQINRVADRARPAGDLRAKVPDYSTVDLTVRTTRGEQGWEYAGSIRNLFNATVIEPSQAPGALLPNDLPMARRSAWLQAIYRL
jgi:iron complex outermembrane receptor protein